MAPAEAGRKTPPGRSELFVLAASSREELAAAAGRVRDRLESEPPLAELAFTLASHSAGGPERLSIVASSAEDLGRKLEHAERSLRAPECRRVRERSGIYWFGERLAPGGKVAFVFPGEGAQYANMLSGLCMEFTEAREWFDRIDRVFCDHERGFLPSDFIYPRTQGEEDRLWRMDGAVEAVFTANAAIHSVLLRLGVRPEMIVGHSTGDYSALMASGCVPVGDEASLFDLMLDLNGLYQELEKEGSVPSARLVAVGSVEPGAARALVERSGGTIELAMDNCPHQFVLAGAPAALDPVLDRLRSEGAILEELPFSRAYHTSLFEPVCRRLIPFYGRLPVVPPEAELWSAATAARLPADAAAIRRISAAQWAQPVRFTETIEAMYDAGARIFVEAGPRGNLTAFITDVLRGRPHLAVPADTRQRRGIDQLLHLLGMLFAHGVAMDPAALFARRSVKEIPLEGPVPPAPPRRPMGLSTGWPEMRLKPETAARIRAEAGGAAGTAKPREAAGAPAFPGTSPAAPAPLRSALPPAARERMLSAHLETMEAFLRMQEEIMHAALAGAPPAGLSAADTARTPATAADRSPGAEAPRAGAAGADAQAPPAESTDPPEPRPADAHRAPAATGSSPAAPEGAASDPDAARAMLLGLVSDRTGYPPEMIDLDLDLEADLGIDSIKRVEILGSFEKESGLLGAGDMDQLSGRRTLREILAFVAGRQTAGSPPAGAPSAASAEADPPVSPDPGRPAGEGAGPEPTAFGLEVIDREGDDAVTVRATLRAGESLFLRDHCLGRDVSPSDPDLTGLPVVPLTMTMEMMAEAATVLAPGRVVIGMEEVRGHRWIVLEEDRLALIFHARRSGGPESGTIHVTVHASPGGESAEPAGPPLAEATILLARDYPAPPAAGELPLRAERPSRWTPEGLYREGMFHGPAFRGVVSMDRWGEDGVEASLVALDPSGHFRGRPSPRYATDPVLLDQPGQVVGLWTAEHLERGYVVFPFRLERLDLYGPPPPAGTAFTCRARIALQGESQVRSDLDIAGADGRLHARLTGWWDRRFDLPRPFTRLLLSPEGGSVGEAWPPEAGGIFATDDYRGCLVDSSSFPGEFFTAHDGFWAEVLARVVLSREEREQWRALKLPAPRRLEWLLGRVAAKEAARRLLEDRWGLQPPPAEIEVRKDPEGRPFLHGSWISRANAPLTLSLSHSGGLAVAVAGIAAGNGAPVASAHGIGVDVETIGRTNGAFAGAAFSPEEQTLFAGLGEGEREEWALRCWCAKEAVAKALGSGFMGNPRNLVAQSLDRATGGVLVGMAPRMAEAFPDLRGAAITAATWRDRNRIYGASTCRRSA